MREAQLTGTENLKVLTEENQMPQYLLERQKVTWQFLPNLSDLQNIKVLLTKMAICRGAKIDKPTLELLTEILLPLDLRAFQVAMATLAESQRQEGETALPSLGDILAAMEEARERFPVFSQGAKEINDKPVFADNKQKRLA
jgi:hypothetical protein